MSVYCKINNFSFDNDDMSLHVDDIYKIQTEREIIRLRTFNTILNRCYGKVRYSVNCEDSYCIFTVPEFIVGTPLYDIVKCIQFIMIKLTNNGFAVKHYKPNILYIYWKKKELATSSYLTIDCKAKNKDYYRNFNSRVLAIEAPRSDSVMSSIYNKDPIYQNSNYNKSVDYSNSNYNKEPIYQNSNYNKPVDNTNSIYNKPINHIYNNKQSIYDNVNNSIRPEVSSSYNKLNESYSNTNYANRVGSNNQSTNKLKNDDDFSFNLKKTQRYDLFDNYIPLCK
jgi:hypothetical protein